MKIIESSGVILKLHYRIMQINNYNIDIKIFREGKKRYKCYVLKNSKSPIMYI